MKQTNLDIGSIGQKLKAAREKRGVSISEVAENTRILSKCISAMEQDDFKSLVAPVYAKSFLRLYAKYLGLDADPLIEEYQREFEEEFSIINEDVRRNLANTDAAIEDKKDNPKEEVDDKSEHEVVEAIFSKWTEIEKLLPFKSISWKKALEYASAIFVIIIIILIARCNNQETIDNKLNNAETINLQMISEPIPNAYINEKGSIDWVR